MAPSVEDAIGARNQPAGLLKDAIDVQSFNQELTFIPYVRLVLPADGYVFWVRKSLVSASAMNTVLMNSTVLNEDKISFDAAEDFVVKGSFHYATDMHQTESAALAVNKVAFASEDHVQQFNSVGPNLIYIASFRGTRFAFSSKGMFYEQMKLWHYEGDAIYANMESQIVDDPRVFNAAQTIVSNSLPSWLSLQYYDPPWPVEVPMPRFPLYPSYLSLQNATPPYGVVHIGPDDTNVDQTIPDFDDRLNQSQLNWDRVRVTLYGLNDSTAQDWLAATIGFIRDAGQIGLRSMPNLRDDKLTQRELFVIAQKKVVQFEVSYNQIKMRDVARQLIESVVPPVVNIDQQIIQL